MRAAVLLSLVGLFTAAHADTPAASENSAGATEPLEPLADGLEPDDAALEPEITIAPKEDVTFMEYRINGRLYMIKVIPAKGPPYYLIDNEGNGEFIRSELAPQITPPLWVIKRF